MRKLFNFFHYLMVPREDNNYRAKALHADFLTAYLMIALGIALLFKNGVAGPTGSVLGFATDITTDKLFELTNQERQKNGLPFLNYNEKLAEAARKKGADMFAKNYWAHYSPEGTAPWDFIHNAGYQYEYAGENLAKNFMFSQGVVDAWMNSQTHRENVLRKEYSDVGFAVVNGILNGEETTLVVQEFGKPLATVAVNSKVSAEKKQAPVTKPIEQTVTEETQHIVTNTAPSAGQAATVLANDISRPKINILPTYLNMNIVFFAFLLLTLAIDFYFAMKLKVVRISGRNITHFMFIGFIFAGLLLITLKGAIL